MGSETEVTSNHKVTFAMLGIASLIGWNAILTGMQFFIEKYPIDEYGDVSVLFPIPLFIGNFVWGLLVPKLAERFSLTQRISVCLAGICVFMVLLPVISLTMKSHFGFDICLITTFIIGSLNSVAQNSMIGLASSVDGSLTGIFWSSTAVGGLTMNAAKAMTLIIFGDGEDGTNIGTLIYFGIAVILTFIAIYLQVQFVKSDYYLHITRQAAVNAEDNDENESYSNTESALSQDDDAAKSLMNKKDDSVSGQLKAYLQKLAKGAKAARFVPVFIWLIYVETFLVFPGVSIFKKPSFSILNPSWSILLLLTIYNLGDLIGKQLSSIQFYNIHFLYGVVVSRVLFLVFFFLTKGSSTDGFFNNDVFAYFNMLGFAISNGFCTAGLMFLGPTRGNNSKTKELISFINSFSLTLGIACGTLLAMAS